MPRVDLNIIIDAAIEAQRNNLSVVNWPTNTLYMPKLLHEDELRAWHAGTLELPLLNPPTLAQFVEVQRIRDSTHPAYPGFGIFATQDIAAGTEIGQYTGLKRPKSRTNDSESLYIAALTPETDVDAERTGNEIRFINDYRNTGQTPSVEYIRYRRSHTVFLGVKTTREVRRGEELLIDYGEQYWKMIKRRVRESGGTLGPDEDSDDIIVSRARDAPVATPPAAEEEDTQAWTRLLEAEVFDRPADAAGTFNPALDWFVREELPELLSSRRRSFTLHKRHRGSAHDTDVFARLGWVSNASSFHEWKVPHAVDLMRFGTTYTSLVSQRADGQKRPSHETPKENGAKRRRDEPCMAPPAARTSSSGMNGKSSAVANASVSASAGVDELPTAYPELEALVHLQQLRMEEVVTDAQYLRFKSTLVRNLERRFS